MRFQDRVVIMTGAGKGIGKVAARMFAEEGARVVAASRTESEIAQTVAEITAAGGTALAVKTDIADEASAQALMDRTVAEWGQIDVLVNNAAMPGMPGRPQINLLDMPIEDWDLVHRINMRGTMLCSKFALHYMAERGSGVIINVSSTAGRQGLEGRTHYCSSKAGLIGFTKALAWDAAKYGVRVNCVVPSGLTELAVAYFQRVADEEGLTLDEVLARGATDRPFKRHVTLQEVAAVYLFLASDESSVLVGQSLNAVGGSWMS